MEDRSIMYWDDTAQKWADRTNDFFVRQVGREWRASARYGFCFPEMNTFKEYAWDIDSFEFATEEEALAFVKRYIVEHVVRRARRYDDA
jgi:hypothetical protein